MRKSVSLALVTAAVAVTLGATSASAVAMSTRTALPITCKTEVNTWATVNYWGNPGSVYRTTQTDCILPRPKTCIKFEQISPVPFVIVPESCSPTSALSR